MKGFNLDLHISVIADVKGIFSRIDPSINIVDWSLSGHTWVFNKQPTTTQHITADTWKDLTMERIQAFQTEYNDFLEQFDFFVVAHPNAFILLYERYGKPIIMVNSCRYDMPYCWTNNTYMLRELNACIKRLHDKKLLTVISNNKADREYMMKAIDTLAPTVVPSLCLYTDMKWRNEEQTKFLVYSRNSPIPPHPLIVSLNSLGTFSWNSLMNYRAIIHFPYEISTMSIFEQISSGIPMFFPSKNYLMNMSLQSMYWQHTSIQPPSYFNGLNQSFWVENADFYDFKFVYFFDSVRDLIKQLETFNEPSHVLDQRMAWLHERKQLVFEQWTNITSHIRSCSL